MKLQGRPVTLLKKETLAQVFSCKFCGISRTPFYTEPLVAASGLNEKLNPKLKMITPQDPDSFVEKLKYAHLQRYIRLNGLKTILPSLSIAFYGEIMMGEL